MAAIETPAPPTAGTPCAIRPMTPRQVRLVAKTTSVVASTTWWLLVGIPTDVDRTSEPGVLP